MPSDDEIDEQDDEAGFLKELRRKAKERDQFEAELTATRREVAVLSAGLGDLSERQRKALLATHDGELTPEGLRASAEELGFVKATEPEPQVPEGERTAIQRTQAASAASEPSGQPNLDAELRAARTEDEVLAILQRGGMEPGVRGPTI